MRLPTSTVVPMLLLAMGFLPGCIATSWLEDGPPSDQSIDDDDDDSAEVCRLAVPDHIVLDHDVLGDTFVPFYVPTTGWALAALHASTQIDGLGLQQIELTLSPSYFLALALETGTFGCSADLPADPADSATQWARRPETDAMGCMQIAEGAAWLDLCRMYPEELPCEPGAYAAVIPSSDQGSTGRDNVEPSVLATAWYAAYAYAMLAYTNGAASVDVDGWFETAADEQAVEKLLTYMHWQTPFVPDLAAVIGNCNDTDVEDCLSQPAWVIERVVGVGAHTAQLEAEASSSCFDRPLTAALVDDYVDAIAGLFPEADIEVGRASAQQALTDGGGDGTSFQGAADAVLMALDEGLGLRLRCPGSNLTTFYGISCP